MKDGVIDLLVATSEDESLLPGGTNMTERRKRLTEKLQELDEHIASGEPVDETLAQPLDQAIGSVRQVIAAPEDSDEDEGALSEILGDIALKLEVTHPRLTQALNSLSEILAGAGI